MLTPAQQAAREGKITASTVVVIMDGNPDAIYRKYQELNGDPTFVPEDLSDNWAVQLGSYLEPFALDWHQRKTGHALTRRGEVVDHPTKPYVCCTLDGFREFDSTVIDAKVSGAFIPLDDIIAYYTPQVIVQRACTKAAHGALLIVHGSAAPVEYEIDIDPDYERKVWTRVEQFWWHVENLVPPVVFPKITPPEQWCTVDLDGDCSKINWAADMRTLLQTWQDTIDGAEANKIATGKVKELLPDDVGKLTCGSVFIRRARNRAVSIRRTV